MFLATGCVKELKENERAWNPYVVNQVLVFESSEKEIDTLVIQTIDNAVSVGPRPELYRYKSSGVYAKRLKLSDNKFATKMILDIYTGTPIPKRPSGVTFEFFFKNAKFGSSYKLKELEKQSLSSVTTKAGTFDDVIKLKPKVYYSEREDEVQFMYWSKKHGYIKFERADGFTWELVEKYNANN